jgi:hypothetical protein
VPRIFAPTNTASREPAAAGGQTDRLADAAQRPASQGSMGSAYARWRGGLERLRRLVPQAGLSTPAPEAAEPQLNAEVDGLAPGAGVKWAARVLPMLPAYPVYAHLSGQRLLVPAAGDAPAAAASTAQSASEAYRWAFCK